jgi:hypothetical protein
VYLRRIPWRIDSMSLLLPRTYNSRSFPSLRARERFRAAQSARARAPLRKQPLDMTCLWCSSPLCPTMCTRRILGIPLQKKSRVESPSCGPRTYPRISIARLYLSDPASLKPATRMSTAGSGGGLQRRCCQCVRYSRHLSQEQDDVSDDGEEIVCVISRRNRQRPWHRQEALVFSQLTDASLRQGARDCPWNSAIKLFIV